jgi:hypothetical protein
LKRLDGILADLRRVKKTIMDATADIMKFAPSNDIEGDCGITLPFQLDTVEAAARFLEYFGGVRPLNTGKHVYSSWPNVMEKLGGHCDTANPYLNPLNRGLNMDFNPDSCPKTLDYLSRTVYMGLHPDWDEAAVAEKIALVRQQ